MSSHSSYKTPSPPSASEHQSLYKNKSKNKEILEKKLKTRRSVKDLISQANLTNSETVSPLQWAKTTDFLKRKIELRPNKEALIEKRILKGDKFGTSPYVMEKCQSLEKQHLQETLNDKLSQRPGSLELIERGVLTVEPGIDNLIRYGSISYPRVTSQNLDVNTTSMLSKPPKPPPLPPINEKSSNQKPDFHKEVVKMNGFVFHHYRPKEPSKSFKEKQEARVAQQAELLKLSAAAENKKKLERELIKFKSDPSYKNMIFELNNLSITILKHECSLRSLPTNGNKSYLISLLAPFAENVVKKHSKSLGSKPDDVPYNFVDTSSQQVQKPLVYFPNNNNSSNAQNTQLTYLSNGNVLYNGTQCIPIVSLGNNSQCNPQPSQPQTFQISQMPTDNSDKQTNQITFIPQPQQQTLYILQSNTNSPALTQINQNIPNSFCCPVYQIMPQTINPSTTANPHAVQQQNGLSNPCRQSNESTENLSDSLLQIEKIWMKIRQLNDVLKFQMLNYDQTKLRDSDQTKSLNNELQRLISLCRLLITDRLDSIRQNGQNDPLNKIEENLLLSHLQQLSQSVTIKGSMTNVSNSSGIIGSSVNSTTMGQLRHNAFVDSDYPTNCTKPNLVGITNFSPLNYSNLPLQNYHHRMNLNSPLTPSNSLANSSNNLSSSLTTTKHFTLINPSSSSTPPEGVGGVQFYNQTAHLKESQPQVYHQQFNFTTIPLTTNSNNGSILGNNKSPNLTNFDYTINNIGDNNVNSCQYLNEGQVIDVDNGKVNECYPSTTTKKSQANNANDQEEFLNNDILNEIFNSDEQKDNVHLMNNNYSLESNNTTNDNSTIGNMSSGINHIDNTCSPTSPQSYTHPTNQLSHQELPDQNYYDNHRQSSNSSIFNPAANNSPIDSLINTPSLFSEHFEDHLTADSFHNPDFYCQKNWHDFEIMDTTHLKPSIL